MNDTDTIQRESEVRTKWAEKTTADGKLRNRFVYGSFREEPLLNEKGIVFAATGTEADFAEKTLEVLKKDNSSLNWQIITNNIKLGKALGYTIVPGECEELLGRCGAVVALGGLPEYFAEREGQKAVIIPAGEKDPAKAAELLNAEPAEENNKKKILMLVNVDAISPDDVLRTTFNLSSFADPERNEVTVLVCGKEFSVTDQARMDSFPPGVRVVTQKGAFSCTADEYVDVHVMMDMLRRPDDTARKVFETEAVRVLGETSFDSIICLGEPDRYCYYMTACLGAGRTTRLDTIRPWTEAEREKVTNGRRRMINGLKKKESGMFDEVIRGLRDIPFDCRGKEFKECSLKTTVYEGNPYCILDLVPENAGERYVQLIPCPDKEGGNLIAYGDSASAEEVLKDFAENSYPYKTLYMYGGQPAELKAIADNYGISERVVFVSKPELSAFKYLKAYIDLFDAYITADAEEYNEVGYLMQKAGKPLLVTGGAPAGEISMEDNLVVCNDGLNYLLFRKGSGVTG